MFDSVKIIHSEENIKEYRFLADFFRLIGIHVCDCTLKRDWFTNEFGFVILIEEGIEKSRIDRLKDIYPKALCIKESKVKELSIYAESTKEKNIWKKYLNGCLEAIKNMDCITDQQYLNKEIEILKKIGEVYVSFQLSYYKNIYGSFYNNKEIMQKAQAQIIGAYITISDFYKSSEEKTSNLLYALANLARMLNETCRFLGQELLLSTDVALRYLDRALQLEPTFNNAYFLKGMLTELDERYREHSGTYYQIAMEWIQNRKYAAYPYYIIGRYYEKIKNDYEMAKKYYIRSIGINSCEYRSIYKLAIFDKKEKRYLSAVEHFKMICNILHEKEEKNYLQPQEYDYLLKAYLQIVEIYETYLDDSEWREVYRKKLYDLCKKITDEQEKNQVYEELFGEQALMLRKETINRFRAVTIKNCLQ